MNNSSDYLIAIVIVFVMLIAFKDKIIDTLQGLSDNEYEQ
jgi:hypothetical protein